MTDISDLLKFQQDARNSDVASSAKKMAEQNEKTLRDSFWKAGIGLTDALMLNKTAKNTMKPILAFANAARDILGVIGHLTNKLDDPIVNNTAQNHTSTSTGPGITAPNASKGGASGSANMGLGKMGIAAEPSI